MKIVLNIFLISFCCLAVGIAEASNQQLTYQGRVVRPDGTAVNSGSLTFTLSLYSPAPSECLLYRETQTIPMTGSAGMFSLNLGAGTRTDGGAHAFNKIFINGSTLSGLTCSSGTSYTAGSTDDRSLVVTFNDAGTVVTLSAMKVKSVPFALQAHEIDGWGLSNLVKVSTIGSPTTFTTAEMANAKAMTGAACASGEVLKWNGSAWGCAADITTGTATDAGYTAANKGIVAFDTNAATSGITVASGVASVNTGTGNNQIVKLDGSAKLPGVDGSALTNLDPTHLSAAVPINKGGTGQITAVLGFNALSPLTAKGDLITFDGTNNVRLPAGTNGYVLSADLAQATGLKWVAASTGTVTSVSSSNGDISVATGTTTPVLTLNSGTGANQIVKLTAAGKYPAVDGSLITSLDAGNISAGTLPVTRGGTGATSFGNNGVVISNVGGTALQTLNCTNGQVISFDTSGYAVCGSAAGATGFVNGGNSFAADATLGTNDNFGLNFETNNTTRMSITSSGFVGIGTTAPNSRFHIGGGSGFSSSTTKPGGGSAIYMTMASPVSGASVSQIIGVNDGARNSRAEFFFDDDPIEGAGAWGLWARYNTGGKQPFVIGVSDAEALRINTQGLVGIGNQAPGALLDIGTVGKLGTLRLGGSTSGYVQIQPAAAAGSWTMTLPADAGTNGYVLSTNGSGVTSWVAQSGGGGSGTVTSVTSANSDIGVASSTTAPVLTLNTGTGNNQIVKLTAAGKYPAVDGSLITSLDAGNISAGTLPVTRGGTGNTTYGNNGVIVSNGTGSAFQTLNCTSGQVITFDVSGYAICGAAAGATGFVNGGNSFAGAATLGTNDNFSLSFETNNISRMTIDNSGKVGIGTSAPLVPLQVGASVVGLAVPNGVGTNTNPQLIVSTTSGTSALSVGVNDGTNNRRVGLFMDDTNGVGGISTEQASTAFPFVFRDAIAERLRIESGKVGIGNSAPGALLDIGTIGKLGTLRLGGSTSGYVQIQPAAAAGSWTMTLPADAGTNGYVLSTNGSGVTSWVAQSGGGGGSFAEDANNNLVAGTSALTSNSNNSQYSVALGYEAQKNMRPAAGAATNISFGYQALMGSATPASNTGKDNVAIGYQALSANTSGASNIALGKFALKTNTTGSNNFVAGSYSLDSNTTGSGNAAIGFTVLAANTTGSQNFAFGDLALSNNTTGSSNFAAGSNALLANTTSGRNIAIGLDAQSQMKVTGVGNNIAFGSSAMKGWGGFGTGTDNFAAGANTLFSLSTGSNNIAVGPSALYKISTGSDNIALGNLAGYTSTAANGVTTGSNNVFIGNDAGPGSTTQISNSMALGNGARVIASNAVSIGNSSVKVGLAGVSNPVSVLDLTGDVNIGGSAAPGVSASGAGKIYFDSTSNKFRVSENAGAFVDLVGASGTGFVNGGNSFGAAATLGTNDNYALNFETNNTTHMTVTNAGDVGVGTNSPNSKMTISKTYGALPAGLNGLFDLYASASGAVTNDSTFKSFISSANVTGTRAFVDFTGIDFILDNATSAGGVGSQSGISSNIYLTSSGNTGAAYGYRSYVELGSSSTGSITNTLRHFEARTPARAGTGTIANAIGLYVEDQKVTGVTTGYGVYQNGSNDLNYFGGKVGIGATSPAAKLEIFGSSGATLKIVDGNQGNGKVLTSDANGVASWAAAPAAGVSGTMGKLAKFTSGTAIGDSLLSETTGQVSVAGQINSTGNADQTSNSPNINFNYGNSLFVAANCTGFTLSNMVSGGSYSFAVQGTSGTCTFTHGADTIHYAGGVSNVTITAHTIFSLVKYGTHVYVTWVSF